MEATETKSRSGYSKPPWLFKGSALYQLHLVKAETARTFIPKEFRLVEAFGYTLGGFFLAHYDDSPAGIFHELVVIAGIVWNPPTSCAWAARVLVDSHDACIHGRKVVGLPSQVAEFSKKITAISNKPRRKSYDFLNVIGMGATQFDTKNVMDIQVTEIEGHNETDFCNFQIPTPVPKSKSGVWMGPAVKMSLPSFSGKTELIPQLLKYSCQIECRVRPVKPARVSGPVLPAENHEARSETQSLNFKDAKTDDLSQYNGRDRSISVLLSKPIFALEFNFMKMQVEAPTAVTQSS
ncbi:hypothetical protein Syun_024607 [Stephania yunnanensis]|uniref:Protein NEOXANTHIN-DEFICIENT 1 n=1 Tax=Stephania yunnanensis TaxID=152371 RepID=A0AAP0NL04_9MAGN